MNVIVEIVGTSSGILCQLAMEPLDEVSPTFKDKLIYSMMDISKPEGLERLKQVRKKLDRKPNVPSILMNEEIVFDFIPDSDTLIEAIRQRLE